MSGGKNLKKGSKNIPEGNVPLENQERNGWKMLKMI